MTPLCFYKQKEGLICGPSISVSLYIFDGDLQNVDSTRRTFPRKIDSFDFVVFNFSALCFRSNQNTHNFYSISGKDWQEILVLNIVPNSNTPSLPQSKSSPLISGRTTRSGFIPALGNLDYSMILSDTFRSLFGSMGFDLSQNAS